MPSPDYGPSFRTQRLSLGISLRALAGELRIAPSTLARWEHGKRGRRQRTREAWAAAIGACAVHRALAMQSAGATLEELQACEVGRLALTFSPSTLHLITGVPRV